MLSQGDGLWGEGTSDPLRPGMPHVRFLEHSGGPRLEDTSAIGGRRGVCRATDGPKGEGYWPRRRITLGAAVLCKSLVPYIIPSSVITKSPACAGPHTGHRGAELPALPPGAHSLVSGLVLVPGGLDKVGKLGIAGPQGMPGWSTWC